MKVVWVLENIKKNFNTKDYYVNSKLNILLLLASVNFWRNNHKDDTCVLYGDELTINTLDRLKVLDFWHQVKLIPKRGSINRNVFWAASKLEVLRTIDEPVIIMDNDTHVYKPIKDKLDLSSVYVCNLEEGLGFYPSSVNNYVRQLSYRPRWGTQSVNVGFLYLPDPIFTKEYAELSIKIMEELTELNAPTPQYLIFAEQMVLKHLLDKKGIKFKTILSNTWDCKKWEWGEENDLGIWSVYDSELYFKHYGPAKKDIKDNKKGENYDREIAHLFNSLRLPNLDLSSIPNK